MSGDRPRYWILDADGNPIPCDDVLVWGFWFERSRLDGTRILARDADESGDGSVVVSTVFLGLDHGWNPTGPPVLWETLVFGGVMADYMERYTSRGAALAGHQRICQDVARAERRRVATPKGNA